ncbi:cell envelope integrity protein CreD [Moraxella oblonga]|uniref:cell envelope integrity protein CreD n=1 Tax=Moraxella oblonga TaxID=200413 RepID=UPI0008333177|nr:cell envelope integrity protein CreD [Moraxella oblonga]
MQKIGTKLVIIATMCIAFLVGMLFLNGLVDERKTYHTSVIDEIKEAHVKHQYLITPFLVMGADTGETLIFPTQSQLDMTVGVRDDEYSRGIYHAISYYADVHAKQRFELPKAVYASTQTVDRATHLDDGDMSANPKTKQNKKAKDPTPKSLTLFITTSDLRGLNAKEVVVNGNNYPVKFAKESKFGIHYLAVDLTKELGADTLSSDLMLSVSGIDGMNVIPLGADFGASMTSNWHEPKFFGQALPLSKAFNADGEGFNATWQGGFITNQNESSLMACAGGSDGSMCPIFEQLEYTNAYQSFGTAFVHMNDTYTQTDRSIKYALLLVMVSFGTFFLFEVIKGLRIHPVQYLLVASALLVFYLLLLSLAEQIAFLYAYLIASLACVGLIGWYTCYMLGSVKRGMGFGMILGLLYTVFYVILSASGLNLLMGSVFCFVCIAIVMVATRHVDWYGLTDKDGKNDKSDKGNKHPQSSNLPLPISTTGEQS